MKYIKIQLIRVFRIFKIARVEFFTWLRLFKP
jgi:hypothetical protein